MRTRGPPPPTAAGSFGRAPAAWPPALPASELEELPDGTDDPLDRRHVAIFDLPVRIRHVETGHAQHRPAEVEDRLLGEDGRDLRAEACCARRLLHDDDAAR